MTIPSDWVQERLARSPIRTLRKGLYPDRAVLCKKLGISDSVVYFAELACYPMLPKRLNDKFFEDDNARREFQGTYHKFQVSERQLFGSLFSLDEVTRLSLEGRVGSPLARLHEELGISRADLGKGLCVQPSLIYRHDRGIAQWLSEELRVAMLQAGMNRDTVDFLDKRQQRYAHRK